MKTFTIQIFDRKGFLIETFKIEADSRKKVVEWLEKTRPNDIFSVTDKKLLDKIRKGIDNATRR